MKFIFTISFLFLFNLSFSQCQKIDKKHAKEYFKSILNELESSLNEWHLPICDFVNKISLVEEITSIRASSSENFLGGKTEVYKVDIKDWKRWYRCNKSNLCLNEDGDLMVVSTK